MQSIFNKLDEILIDEQSEYLTEIDNLTTDLELEAVDTYFRAGFKYGLRLAAECFLCWKINAEILA